MAHPQENLNAANYKFLTDDLHRLSVDLSQIKIVGDRYIGVSAEQTKK